MSHQLTRRSLLATAFAGLATAGLAACSSGTAQQKASSTTSAGGSASALGSTTIGLTYIPNIQFAPFYLGMANAVFAEKGVSASLRHHGASEALFSAIQGGTEQFVIAGGDELIQARAGGMDLVAIASYYRTYPVVVIVLDGSSITDLAGLKGKTIGIPGKYGESWFGLQVALKNAGLSESDVTIKEIGYTQQAALSTKKVDAIIGFSNNDAVQFTLNKVAVRQIPLGDNVPLVSIVLAATQKLLDAKPALAKAVADATVEAIKQVVADPSAAIKAAEDYVPNLAGNSTAQASATATLDATITLFQGSDKQVSGKLDAAQWPAMATFMKSTGLITTAVDASQAFSTDYVSS